MRITAESPPQRAGGGELAAHRRRAQLLGHAYLDSFSPLVGNPFGPTPTGNYSREVRSPSAWARGGRCRNWRGMVVPGGMVVPASFQA
jgi:hypothetical protein